MAVKFRGNIYFLIRISDFYSIMTGLCRTRIRKKGLMRYVQVEVKSDDFNRRSLGATSQHRA